MKRPATLLLAPICALALLLLLLHGLQPAPTAAAPALPAAAGLAPQRPLTEAERQKAAQRLDEALLRQLRRAPDGEGAAPITAIVRLTGRADLAAATAGLTGRATRGAAIVAALQAHAARAQAGLRTDLAAARAAGLVVAYRPYFIFNGILVTAPAETIWRLALRDDVAAITPDTTWSVLGGDGAATGSDGRSLLRPFEPGSRNLQSAFRNPQSAVPEWNITQIGADAVWSQYALLGQGVIVAGLDTGVHYTHPALVDAYAGNLGGGAFNHDYAWFDATGISNTPFDDNGHGTHTMGTIVGGDGPGPLADDIGVAPGATWIAAKAINGAGFGTSSAFHAAFEWLLAPCPAGVQPGGPGCDPARAPHLINNSWGSPVATDLEFRDDLIALRAAGIWPVFSAGNSGPAPATLGSPASYPQAFAVGATDGLDAIADFSSRGPSPLTPAIKPEVVAPGVAVRSALPGGGYGLLSGTSMAGPHVAGLGALLLSAAPELDLPTLESIVLSSALDRGDPGPDMTYGHGRIDALAAVERVLSSGTISGTVSELGGGDPVAGATVRAVGQGLDLVVKTGAAGDYRLDYLIAGGYTVTASSYGYAPLTAVGVSVLTDTTTVQDFALTALPRYVISGTVSQALSPTVPITNAVIQALETPLDPVSSGPTGFYSLTVAAGPVVVEAAAFGYATGLEALTVTADTTLNFALNSLPPVLLVDDDEGQARSYAPHVETYYFSALDSNGYNYTYWDIEELGAPDFDTMRQYPAVVWFGGEVGRIRDISDAGQADAVMAYLDAGGQLLYVAQEHTFYFGDDGICDSPTWGGEGPCPFTRDYLGILDWVEDQKATQVFGVPGDPVGGGFGTIDMSYPPLFSDFTDHISARVPAASLAFTGTDYSFVGENNHVAHTLLTPTQTYRTVFFATPLEAMPGADAADLLFAVMSWFGITGQQEGLTLAPSSQQGLALAGEAITYTIRLRNLGAAAETIALSVVDAVWETTIWDAAFTAPLATLGPVGPAETADFGVRVLVPAGTPGGAETTSVVRAVAQGPIPHAADATLTAGARMVYVVRDSDLCGSGVIYDWVDATGGDRWDLDEDDPVLPEYVSIALPSPFKFYNQTHDHVWVNDHGTVLFGDDNIYDDSFPSGTPPIPNPTLTDPNGAIYAAWGNTYWHPTDQDPAAAVYTLHDTAGGANRFVIEYHRYENLFGGPDTFEIILDLDTYDILVQYQTISHHQFTVMGIEDPFGTVGVLYVNDQIPPENQLHDGLAVRFGVGEPPPVEAVRLAPEAASAGGLPGEAVDYTLTVQNNGEGGDSYDLELGPSAWSVALFDAAFTTPLTAIGPIAACDEAAFGVRVTLPPVPAVTEDVVQVRARSQQNPLVAATAVLTTTAPVPAVGALADQALVVAPGQQAVFALAVVNAGTVTDTYTLALSGFGWATTLGITTTTLSPGGSEPVAVTVAVPPGAPAGAQDAGVVSISSVGYPPLSVSATLTATAAAVPAISLPGNQNGGTLPGGMVVYTLLVTNAGNLVDTLTLTLSPSIWSTTFGPPYAGTTAVLPDMAIGESRAVVVSVAISPAAELGASDSVDLTAVSAADEDVTASLTLVTLARLGDHLLFLPAAVRR